MTPVGASGAPGVARAATVLKLLAIETRGMGVNEIARRLGFFPSTTFHILRALVNEGFISLDTEKKTYHPGAGLLALARKSLVPRNFPKIVQPELDILARDHRVTAVAIEQASCDRMVVVAGSRASSRSAGSVSVHIKVGSHYPAYSSATGRCIAAFSDPPIEKLKSRFDALKWHDRPEFSKWLSDIERVRIEKVGVDRNNFLDGVTVLATLIPSDSGRVIRGISVVGFSDHIADADIDKLKTAIASSASSVAAQLR